jgi:hypothetical protein
MLLFIKLLQGYCSEKIAELQDDNKLLEQPVTNLLNSTAL